MPRLGSILSTSTRLNKSAQRSLPAMRMPAACAAHAKRSRSATPSGNVAEEVDAGKTRESLRDGKPFRRGKGIRAAAAKCQLRDACRARCFAQDCRAVFHQRFIGLGGAVPFDERKFRMVKRD
jgi:hypothetical protein